MLYLGIDQHSKQLTVNARNERGEAILKRQVSTKWHKLESFFDDFQRLADQNGGYVAVVEVCGFNDWLLDKLPGWGCQKVILVQPEERSRQKTDRRDAGSLSEALWVNRERLLDGESIKGLRRVYIATKEEREKRTLTSHRQNIGRELTSVINSIKHMLRQYNIEQECPTKGIRTVKARQWLDEMPLPRVDRMKMNQLLTRWDLLNKDRDETDELIRDLHSQDPKSKSLTTLPGAGAYTCLALSSRIGPIERFKRPRSLANYLGLTPGSRNSGDVKQRLGSITKQGSATARFLLGQMVLHVLRTDEHMRKWYQRIKKRRGAKIARVAVMRRLATIIWNILTYDMPYLKGDHLQDLQDYKTGVLV